MAEDKREKAKVLLAANLERAYLMEFLYIEDVVASISVASDKTPKSSFVAGLKRLIALHDFARIIGPLYAHWQGKKEDNLALFEAATKDFDLFVVILFKHISFDDTVTAFGELLHAEGSDGHPVTWDNLVHAFPYRDLDACLTKSMARAAKAAEEEAICEAPEAEVVEEVMEIEPDGK